MHLLKSLSAGRSVSGALISAFKSEIAADKFCYLIAGTHGDEPESVFVQNALVEWLKTSEVGTPFVIVPALNPDGLQNGVRSNVRGVDLNRNLPASNWEKNDEQNRYYSGPEPLSEPENVFLLSLFSKYPPGFIISFHSWKPMLNSNGECEDILQLLHSRNNYPIVREDIDGHPTPGSLGSYVSEILGIPMLTYELPTIEEQPDFQSIWQENQQGLIELMQSHLLDNYL